jgi:hypothetical protein
MSLDLFARLPKVKLGEAECYCTPVNIGDLSMFTDGAIHLGNITHNLNKMALQVPVSESLNLYDVLWESQEQFGGDIDKLRPMWDNGLHYMLAHRDELEKYNPENGYGNYDIFVEFLRIVIFNSEKLIGIGVRCESDR